MNDEQKTKAQLVRELRILRAKLNRLEKSKRPPSRARDASKESAERYRLIFENSGEAILFSAPDGRIFSANPAACRMFGRTEDEIRKIGRSGLVDTSDPRLPAVVEGRKKPGKINGELNHVRKDGTVFPLEVSSVIFKDSRGNERAGVFMRDITERKQTEIALQKREQQLKDAQRAAGIGNWEWDALTDASTCSDELYRLFGRGPKSFKFSLNAFLQSPHPDDREMVEGHVRQLFETRQPTDFDYRIVTPAEEVRWLYSRSTATVDDSGRIIRLRGTVQDITKRKQAEEVAREAHARIESILTCVADTHILFDRQWRYLYVNDAAAQSIGRPREQILGRTLWDLYPDIVGTELENQYRRAMEERVPVQFDFHYRTFDTWWDNRFYPSAEGLAVFASDITERKQAEEALAESERKLRTLFEILPVGVSILNAERKIVYVNPALERILDISKESLFRGDYRSRTYIRPDGRPMPAEEFASVRAIKEQQGVHNVETGVVKEDGTVIWSTVSAVPLGFSDWEVLVVTSDITERKRTEEALRASEERYRRLFEGDLAGDYVSTPAGKLIACNAAFARIFRFKSIDDALATDTHDLYPNPEARQLFLRSLRQNRRLELREAWMKRRDGTDLHVIENSFGVFDDKGELIEIRGYLLDDTGRKLAEKALRESEGRFRELFNRMSSGVAVYEAIDSGGDFIFRDFNPAAERIEKVSRKDILGKRVTETFPRVKTFGVFEVFQRVWQTGKPEYLSENIYKDERDPGSWRENSVFKLPTGEIVAIYNDITERKQAEERLLATQEQLHMLAGHLQNVREEERKHLSQEFHDQLGQTLTALKMDLALLHRELADKTREISRSTLGEKIQSMQGLIDTGIQAIRETMSELHPELLDQLGLVAALEWEAERFQKRSGVRCQFTSVLGEIQFDPKKSIALFRIFQEAVTNVARHSQATIAEISVRREKDDIILEIKDNGVGIEPGAENTARSFGLIGMRERAIVLGGTVEITGIRGKGTTVLVRMPSERLQHDGGVPQ